jgi:uncharacterized phiE125 gp8 family phage protein
LVKPPKPIAGQTLAPFIDLEDVRAHLRLDASGSPPTHPDDELIEALVEAAREFIEGYTEQSWAVRTFEQSLAAFPPGPIELGIGPHISLTSIEYKDEDNADATIDLDDVVVDSYGDRALVYPAVNFVWPRTYQSPVAITITFKAGFGPTASSPIETVHPVPKAVRAAALLIVGHLYENREDTVEKALTSIPMGALALIQRYRTRQGV